jgi:hypothetical protein
MHRRQLPSWRPTTPDLENRPRPLTLLLDGPIPSMVTVIFDGLNTPGISQMTVKFRRLL